MITKVDDSNNDDTSISTQCAPLGTPPSASAGRLVLWRVFASAEGPAPIETKHLSLWLASKDLGGQVSQPGDAPGLVRLVVELEAATEDDACQRVEYKMQTALGAGWSVQSIAEEADN